MVYSDQEKAPAKPANLGDIEPSAADIVRMNDGETWQIELLRLYTQIPSPSEIISQDNQIERANSVEAGEILNSLLNPGIRKL